MPAQILPRMFFYGRFIALVPVGERDQGCPFRLYGFKDKRARLIKFLADPFVRRAHTLCESINFLGWDIYII